MSNLLLCFRNVRRSIADSRGFTQLEFWTKWSDIRSLEFSVCNITGSQRTTVKLDHEYLYIHCKEDSSLRHKLIEAHLLPFRPSVVYIDDDAIHHNTIR